jgi:hypothetical protein
MISKRTSRAGSRAAISQRRRGALRLNWRKTRGSEIQTNPAPHRIRTNPAIGSPQTMAIRRSLAWRTSERTRAHACPNEPGLLMSAHANQPGRAKPNEPSHLEAKRISLARVRTNPPRPCPNKPTTPVSKQTHQSGPRTMAIRLSPAWRASKRTPPLAPSKRTWARADPNEPGVGCPRFMAMPGGSGPG